MKNKDECDCIREITALHGTGVCLIKDSGKEEDKDGLDVNGLPDDTYLCTYCPNCGRFLQGE